MFITSKEQVEFFHNYYSYELIELFNKLKDKNKNYKLLNKCSKETLNNFVDLIGENIDLKNMYLSHLKS
tara:strand:- start:114 stop:320 length:207 start_codon:yes stop_codon:yes gene_type:complete